MTFSDWNLVGCRTPHDPVQLSSQRLQLSEIGKVSVPADGAGCASGATQISQRAWLELCSHQPMLKSGWVSHRLGQSRSGASRQQVKPGAQRPESGNSRAQRLREALDSQQGFE